jgi:hypothetical protein
LPVLCFALIEQTFTLSLDGAWAVGGYPGEGYTTGYQARNEQ